jgi:dTDP-4-dehydrorhamnose reductase
LKLLITGASGLVGARLTEAASRASHDVVETYSQHQISRPNALQVDIRDKKTIETIMKKTSPDVTIHLASLTDVDLCEREPELANSVNANATHVLAEECLNSGSHFVYVSTDYVFDGKRGNYREDDQPNPVNTYGRSKLRGEEVTRATSDEFCVTRTSVVYGWGRSSRQNFGSWAYSELKAGRPVKVVENQYCSPTLNSQLARMLLEVAEAHLSGTIHLAGASRLSRYEFAQELANEFNFEIKLIVPINSKTSTWFAQRPLDSSLNVNKAHKLLSNKPVDIKNSLREFALETRN